VATPLLAETPSPDLRLPHSARETKWEPDLSIGQDSRKSGLGPLAYDRARVHMTQAKLKVQVPRWGQSQELGGRGKLHLRDVLDHVPRQAWARGTSGSTTGDDPYPLAVAPVHAVCKLERGRRRMLFEVVRGNQII